MLAPNDFDFALPKGLIAQRPSEPRNHARLLVYDRKTGHIADDIFYNLDQHLPAQTTLVINNSKVEKCRLRLPGNLEIFVLETIDPKTIKAMVRPGKKFAVGLHQIAGFSLKVDSITDGGLRVIKLDRPIDDPSFAQYRLTPLPPYINQDESLSEDYQTVYAKPLGSKAAPTAGLHFTAAQLRSIRARHDLVEVTLHVGLGTFAPVKAEHFQNHRLHGERYSITPEAAAQLNRSTHITAVGTTSVRVLESAGKPFIAKNSETDIFITPGYSFKQVDALITNFHLPKSSLLMLVAAFVGSVDEVHRLYRHAIKEGYRFYSFGDAMLIL